MAPTPAITLIMVEDTGACAIAATHTGTAARETTAIKDGKAGIMAMFKRRRVCADTNGSNASGSANANVACGRVLTGRSGRFPAPTIWALARCTRGVQAHFTNHAAAVIITDSTGEAAAVARESVFE